MKLRNIFDFDTCMLTLGLATLVVQWRWEDSPPAEKQLQPIRLAAAAPVQSRAHAPQKGDITFPQQSNYQSVTDLDSVQPNLSVEVAHTASQFESRRNWALKERALDSLLAAHAGKDYLFILQQQVAREMLQKELFHHYYQDPREENMLQSLAFYTELLLQGHSEDAKLIYMCLRALQDHWPEKKRSQVAQLVTQRLEKRWAATPVDTTQASGYYQQVYARELRKIAGANQQLATR